jgi:hypothetical protein
MKKLILILSIALSGTLSSQVSSPPGANSGGNTPVPINPGQTTLPYNGTNPAGEPNQSNSYTTTAPGQSGGSGGSYQPTVQPNPVVPTTPAVPNIGTNPYKNLNRLFQDPSRTPGDPKQVDPVRMPSGSTGKYHKPKKAMSGKTFAHNKSHIKTSKSNSERSHEPSSATSTH